MTFYHAMGEPVVSSLTFWTMYQDLLALFHALPDDPQLAKALCMADEGADEEVPILTGLRELWHGDNIIGENGTKHSVTKINIFLKIYHVFNIGGRRVCQGCYRYYKQKETTKRRELEADQSVASAQLNVEHRQAVHQQVYPPEYTNVVQPVGFAYSNPIAQHSSLLTFQAGHLVQSTNGPICMATAISTIQLLGKRPQASPFTASAGVVLGGSSGYTKNHLSYQMTCQTLANNAYALHGGHVVIVEVWAIHMPVGKTKAQLIRIPWLKDVLQAVNNVPVHIGAVELKGLLYECLLPKDSH
ncbi:hypothetical protein L208DRAFT_1378304 [Tricholoma matsutake]|nr:hypothetical protein L208DRAFT_1378304 [Tricholoma matsutake 945]